jgi:hypothetical protein
MAVRSFYKGDRLGKTPACCICGGPGEGPRGPLHLTHGVTVWLCEAHRDGEFLRRRAGRDLVASLTHVFRAAGCDTGRRRMALVAHLARVQRAQAADVGRERPGSWSWPRLRRQAEARWARGESPAAVIAELRERHARDHATVPSARTMQRWFAEGRWLGTDPARAGPRRRP